MPFFVLVSFLFVGSVGASSEMWSQTYGGTSDDSASSSIWSSDGGYALAGSTKSFGAGGSDAWLVKTDEYGNVEWTQTYGGTSHDSALSLIETSDVGYALAGTSNSFGGYWLVKTDAVGNILWNYTYRSGSEHAYSLVETSDGGYALTGCLPDLGFGAGSLFWLVKADSDGNMEWIQTYNGGANSIIETSDGGFALSGGNLLVKTDADGNIEWNQTYNGTAHSLVQTPDGGYAIAGTKNDDFWLIKTDEHGVIPEFPLWLILPLFLMTVLFAVALKRRIRYRSAT
jgi:hypothetical protein